MNILNRDKLLLIATHALPPSCIPTCTSIGRIMNCADLRSVRCYDRVSASSSNSVARESKTGMYALRLCEIPSTSRFGANIVQFIFRHKQTQYKCIKSRDHTASTRWLFAPDRLRCGLHQRESEDRPYRSRVRDTSSLGEMIRRTQVWCLGTSASRMFP